MGHLIQKPEGHHPAGGFLTAADGSTVADDVGAESTTSDSLEKLQTSLPMSTLLACAYGRVVADEVWGNL